MAANGLMYTAKFQSVTVTNAAQNLWEMITGAASILIHSIRIEFVPTITSGVAQDVRAAIAIQTISSTGTGGSAVTPVAEHPRNTIASLTTVNSLVTTPGTLALVKSASNPSVIVPFERIFTPDQRIPVASGGGTGGRLAINLAAGLGGSVVMSSEIYFEEF
jgi:hypothetical protein